MPIVSSPTSKIKLERLTTAQVDLNRFYRRMKVHSFRSCPYELSFCVWRKPRQSIKSRSRYRSYINSRVFRTIHHLAPLVRRNAHRTPSISSKASSHIVGLLSFGPNTQLRQNRRRSNPSAAHERPGPSRYSVRATSDLWVSRRCPRRALERSFGSSCRG